MRRGRLIGFIFFLSALGLLFILYIARDFEVLGLGSFILFFFLFIILLSRQ